MIYKSGNWNAVIYIIPIKICENIYVGETWLLKKQFYEPKRGSSRGVVADVLDIVLSELELQA